MERDERIEALERELQGMREEHLGKIEALKRELDEVTACRSRMPRLTGSLALVVVLVVGLTGLCARRAWAAATVPSAVQVTLHTSPTGLSTPITIPVNNQTVIVSGTTYSSNMGTGFVHLTYTPAEPLLTWAGVHAENGATSSSGIAAGYTDLPGTRIVDVAFNGNAELQTGPSLNQLRVKCNVDASLDTRLTLIW